MATPIFPQRKEADLLAWSEFFSTYISGSPATVGLLPTQATNYATLHSTFSMRYETAINPASNSRAATIAKNAAKEALLNGPDGAWQLVNIVQAFPGTSDAIRGELGLRIPNVQPAPVPPPRSAPQLSITSVIGRAAKVRLRDADDPESRGKPEGVQGATVLYFVGEDAPQVPEEWIFAANTGKTIFEVDIPGSVPAGSKVWLTAFWFNSRKEASMAATAESFRVNDGLAQAA